MSDSANRRRGREEQKRKKEELINAPVLCRGLDWGAISSL